MDDQTFEDCLLKSITEIDRKNHFIKITSFVILNKFLTYFLCSFNLNKYLKNILANKYSEFSLFSLYIISSIIFNILIRQKEILTKNRKLFLNLISILLLIIDFFLCYKLKLYSSGLFFTFALTELINLFTILISFIFVLDVYLLSNKKLVFLFALLVLISMILAEIFNFFYIFFFRKNAFEAIEILEYFLTIDFYFILGNILLNDLVLFLSFFKWIEFFNWKLAYIKSLYLITYLLDFIFSVFKYGFILIKKLIF